MNELPVSEFEKAIHVTHGANASLESRALVKEVFEERTVWEGEVLVFSLQGHPTATKCYAWSVDGRVTAVLHEGLIDSPQAAVRAAIASEYKTR